MARADALNPSMRLIASAVMALLMLGCGPRVPPIPDTARDQHPRDGAPSEPWRGHGRLEVTAPGRRLSGDLHVRVRGDQVLVAILADGGVRLLEGTVTVDGADVGSVVDDLRPHAPGILALAGAWLPLSGTAAWHGNHRIRRHADQRRHYGGDPVLLRRIDGTPWPVRIEDYRPFAGDGLLAHALTGEGPFGVRIRLRLLGAERSP